MLKYCALTSSFNVHALLIQPVMLYFLTGILGSIFDGIQRPLKVGLTAVKSGQYIFTCINFTPRNGQNLHVTKVSNRGDNG